MAKIADFGLATGSGLSTSARTNASGGGTITHSAPEVLEGDPFTPAADVYGFGMIVYEAATDDIPFEDCANSAVVTRKICDKAERPLCPPKTCYSLTSSGALSAV